MKRKILALFIALTAIFACTAFFAACIEQEQFSFFLSDDGTYYICEAAKNTDTDTEIVIPSEYNGKPVGEVRHFWCDNLESVTIPDSVTKIGWQGFSGCTKLKNVSIGNGVKEIGEQAFGGCTALESIVIPDNVITIGEYAFDQCHNLKTVILNGKKEITFGDYCFNDCSNLKGLFCECSHEDWVESGSSASVKIHFYSETAPTDDNCYYWHYVDGLITAWEN